MTVLLLTAFHKVLLQAFSLEGKASSKMVSMIAGVENTRLVEKQ